MYVKKFEGDNLEETLKSVKLELGPDAIILKTITNKGLKGAFKKNRIQITAAISEDDYLRKAKVDKVLDGGNMKDQFYNNSASVISHAINEYSGDKKEAPIIKSGYGALGLNIPAQSSAKKNAKPQIRDGKLGQDDETSSLDNFLGGFASEPAVVERVNRNIQENFTQEPMDRTEIVAAPISNQKLEQRNELRREVLGQAERIKYLESKINELSENVYLHQETSKKDSGLLQLHTTLKTLDLDAKIIQQVIRKGQFELTPEDQSNPDIVYEFALRELHQMIKIEMPLFSKVNSENEPVITIILGEGASGQSAMAKKMAVIQNASYLIEYNSESSSDTNSFTSNFFNINKKQVKNNSEIVTLCRKNYVDKNRIVIDYKVGSNDQGELKKLCDMLKKCFKNVEVLTNISAIHSELYNRKIVSKFREITDGVIISHVDLCLNFGALINVHYYNNSLPLKFFGTGTIVPDDIEAASADRILGSMLQL